LIGWWMDFFSQEYFEMIIMRNYLKMMILYMTFKSPFLTYIFIIISVRFYPSIDNIIIFVVWNNGSLSAAHWMTGIEKNVCLKRIQFWWYVLEQWKISSICNKKMCMHQLFRDDDGIKKTLKSFYMALFNIIRQYNT